MTLGARYCQTEEFEVRESPITGRQLKVNRSTDKLLVDPERVFAAPAIAAEWVEALRSPDGKMKHPTRAVSAAIRAFASIDSSHDFARKIDALMDAGRECEKSPGQKNHIYGWLLRLWAGGIVAIPRDFPFATKTSLFPNPFMMHGFPWLTELQEAYGGANRARVVTTVFRIAGRTLGVMEPGDIVPETVAPAPPVDGNRLLSFMVPPLLLVQRDHYGLRATYSRSSWGLGRVKRKVGVDRTFAWATENDPTLSDWRHAMSQWLSDQRQGLALRTYMAERALQYLIDNPNLPRTVAAYCDRETSIEPTWSEWVSDAVAC